VLNIEVAYAKADRQVILPVQVPDNCTVEEAVQLSGILECFPEISLVSNKVGIFSEICPLTRVLQEDDRVEIYRPLAVDPMEARRQRALKQAQNN
jgi:putative ubiquitin-RnfH superfamily antitoxin RatB of RatAB toxin-antitoxin module